VIKLHLKSEQLRRHKNNCFNGGEMLVIQLAKWDSPNLSTLYKWFDNEWDDVEPLAASKDGKIIPNPIIALNGDELIGGLVFTRFLSPMTKTQAVWINAVFIKPENRKQGISSQLISHAEQLVKEMGEPELLVFTHIPELYLKQKWQVIETQEDNFVLKSSLV
jgi:GNAT superfamily N-acetyltransferase